MKRWESNLAAVWGQMTTGGGHTSLSNTMSVLGIPVMAKGSFTPTQNDIGEWWRKKLHESMIEAGKEEKRLAEQNGEYHHGVPAISVIVDRGWSKRAHNIHTTQNLALAFLLVGTLESYSLLMFRISTVHLVLEVFQQKNTNATKTGRNLHQRWKQT